MKILPCCTVLFCYIYFFVLPAQCQENGEQGTPAEITTTEEEWDDQGVKFWTKRYYRKGQIRMTIQSRDIPGQGKYSTLFLKYSDQVFASFPLKDGKITGRMAIEPRSELITFRDEDENGIWDMMLVCDDDAKILERFKRTKDGLIEPLSGKELAERKERQKQFRLSVPMKKVSH